MNKEKGMKWVVRFFIFINVYAFIADFLVILGKSKFAMIPAPVILFPFFVYIAACLLINNKYWILGCVFSGLQSIAQFIASKYFETSKNTVYNLPDSSITAIAAGMICLLLSSFLFYKLLQVPDIVSKKHTYKWMLALDNYLKQKYRISK